MTVGWPVPTSKAVAWAAAGLVPAVLGSLAPALSPWLWFLDGVLLAAVVLDGLRAPSLRMLSIERMLPAAFSSGRPNTVTLSFELAPGVTRPIRLSFRDWVSPGPVISGHTQSITVDGATEAHWVVTPTARGDLQFGPLTIRFEGPWGLCRRQVTLALQQSVRVYPDLGALTADALALARSSPQDARRVVRKQAEGREFDSMREYRPGDDKRTIDWKATARRARPMVKVHRPERNQAVWLLLDCGRHMAGETSGRRKLDAAVDAALRVAKVAIDAGDQVGVVAFGATVQAFCPLGKGLSQLPTLARFLYRIEASLEESNVRHALERAFARHTRRSLVVVLTDLLDADPSAGLVGQLRRLTPRHLPLVASLRDEAVHAAATAFPRDVAQAHLRSAAVAMESEAAHAVTRLTRAGTKVVRATAHELGASAVSAYLDIKQRGLL